MSWKNNCPFLSFSVFESAVIPLNWTLWRLSFLFSLYLSLSLSNTLTQTHPRTNYVTFSFLPLPLSPLLSCFFCLSLFFSVCLSLYFSLCFSILTIHSHKHSLAPTTLPFLSLLSLSRTHTHTLSLSLDRKDNKWRYCKLAPVIPATDKFGTFNSSIYFQHPKLKFLGNCSNASDWKKFK